MPELINCPICHHLVETTDYFCKNCGHNLRPAPLSTSASAQVTLYLKSLLLPPMGIIWGVRYLRQSDTASKLVGLFAIIITIAELIWIIQATTYTINTVNQQITKQVQLYGI